MTNDKDKSQVVVDLLAQNVGFKPLFSVARAVNLPPPEVRKLIDAAVLRGLLVKSIFDNVSIAAGLTVLDGVISAHEVGFGFVRTEDDVSRFVPPPQMKGLITGDVVRFAVVLNPKDGREQAEILSLVSRPESFWLGSLSNFAGEPGTYRGDSILFTSDEPLKARVTLKVCRKEPLTLPLRDNEPSICANFGNGLIAREHDVVQVRIPAGTPYGESVEGEVVAHLGQRSDIGFTTQYAMAKWRIPAEFSEAAKSATQALPVELDGTTQAERKDLRGLPFVTIDGEDTRDHDDAIFARTEQAGTRLWVAIADVTYYVRPGEALDNDARERGNSVYFPETVVPMFPERLSNGLCSLVEGKDRLALVCEALVTSEGIVRQFQFFEAVIHVRHRLTYTDVDEILSAGRGAAIEQLQVLQTLARARTASRAQAGVLKFDYLRPTIRVLKDEVTDVRWEEDTIAHQLVEECMLVANALAARFLQERGLATLYRHQPAPEGEKWDETQAWFAKRGLALPAEATAKSFQTLLDSYRGHEDYSLVVERIRKALSPAVYDTQNASHFSLGTTAYTHFTSPIRRYPDVLTHRAIKAALAGATQPTFAAEESAAHVSETSKRADQASRWVWNVLKKRFFSKKVGEEFSAKVVFCNKRGLGATLDRWDVVGWLSSDALAAANFAFDEASEAWVGSNVLELGRRLQVRLVATSDTELRLAFPDTAVTAGRFSQEQAASA